MTKQTVSYEKVLDFRIAAQRYQARHGGKFSKFLYALGKVLAKTKAHQDEFDDKQAFLNLKHAKLDKDGFALMEKFTRKLPNGTEQEDERYRYTNKEAEALHKAKRASFQETVEVECWEVPEGQLVEFVPDDMDFNLWQVFSPFMFPEEPTEEVMEKLIARTAEKK